MIEIYVFVLIFCTFWHYFTSDLCVISVAVNDIVKKSSF